MTPHRPFRSTAAAVLFCLPIFLPLAVISGQSSSRSAASSSLVLDGLEIEFDERGDWNRMYSTYRQPVSFPDRVGLRKAYTIAEEKGKAQIVRFMQENVRSERLIDEVNRESQSATRTQNGKVDATSRTIQREMVESVREFTRSYSEGVLRGITVIEQGFDEKAEEVWVKIGLSRRSVRLGSEMQNDIANPRKPPTESVVPASRGAGVVPSEIRKRPPPTSF